VLYECVLVCMRTGVHMCVSLGSTSADRGVSDDAQEMHTICTCTNSLTQMSLSYGNAPSLTISIPHAD